MYENIVINEPRWKSWIIQTTTPLFTPDQCRQIIEAGRRQPPQTAQVGTNKPGGGVCLLYTSPSPRDAHEARMPSSA